MAAKVTLALALMLCCASAALAHNDYHPECYGDHDCHTSEQCKTPKCNGGKCEFWPKNDGCDCDDGNACTVGDKCYSGKCVSGGLKTCTSYSGNQCKYSVCNSHTGQCEEKCKPNGTGCNSGNKCSTGDYCYSGKCKCGKPKTCPNKGPCYKSYCNTYTGQCVCEKKRDGTPCDDGKYETYNDKCCNGVCKGTYHK